MKNTKMLWIALTGLSISLLTACGDDISDSASATATSVQVYHVTASATAAQPQEPTSRALSTVSGSLKALHSEWTENDDVRAFVIADGSANRSTEYSKLLSASKGRGSLFTGSISANKNKPLTTSTAIAFFYPGKATLGTSRTIRPVTETKDGQQTYHAAADNITSQVELNISRQDGTPETIGERFDFQWKKASPSRVDGSNLNISIGAMKRVVAFWGLRFTDSNNRILTNIDSVYISNVKSTDVFDLATGQFLSNNPDDEAQNIVLTPPAGRKISSAAGKYTYVALIPDQYNDVMVMVYVKDKCYKKEFARLSFDADKAYHSDLLQMEEVTPKAFVPVQGIRWAPGNFIHYGPENGGYWGIAPTQWWISRRAVQLGSNRKPVASGGLWQSSQFEDGPVQTTDDDDLFRYGNIVNALNLRMADYKAKNTDIGKTFWNNDRPLFTNIVGREQARYGDIVWYYTMNNHRKYRMPNKAEMETLVNQANVIPGYCYTDKGTVVYGAYFTTHTSGARIKTFPTKVKDYGRYTNVTALVRAGKGLFLPITGRRMTGYSIIGLRDMTWGSDPFGQYATSTSSFPDYAYTFLFGTNRWQFNGIAKGEASAIRPVLETDDGRTDTPYYAFDGIK